MRGSRKTGNDHSDDPLRCRHKIGGIAEERSETGRVIGGHSYDDLSSELPDDGVTVDLDHNGQEVGRLVYGEIADDGRLLCVVVLDGPEIREVEQDIYFSPELLMVGRGVHERSYIAREAQLLGLVLTLSPATLGAWPVSWRAGDVRERSDLFQWPYGLRTESPLLARAADHLQDRRGEARSISRLVDRRMGAGCDEYPRRAVRTRTWLPTDELESIGGRPVGKMRYRPPGKVLRVY